MPRSELFQKAIRTLHTGAPGKASKRSSGWFEANKTSLSMQKSNFYEFTRPVQERFIGSVNGTGMPTPLLERRGGPALPFHWLGLSAGGLLLTFILYPIGLGSLESRMAIQSFVILLLYIGGIAALGFGILMTAKAWREIKVLPFRPGIYVFPIGVVDAREYILKIFPLSEISNVEQTANELVISLEGGNRFAFPFPSINEIKSAADRLDGARSHLQQAMGARESLKPGALAGIDPFHGAASPFVPNKPLLRDVPLWAKVPWAFAAAGGVLLGLLIWFSRNNLGDRRLYAAALERNDVAAYQAYLLRGRKYREDVERIRLPRAELRIVQQNGSVDAIEEYIKAHPNSAIPDEVQDARHTALLKELEVARGVGTVTALKDFDFHHPRHGLDAELKKALHAVYVAAFEKYKTQFASKDAEALRFMEQLIGHVEQKGPTVLVRFRRKPSKTLEKADGLVTKNNYFNGTQSFPSKYFTAERLAPRESDTAAAIVARFSEAFPKDVLSAQLGDAVKDPPEGPQPPPPVPTLFIEHEVEWAGGVATSTNPRGVFIGAGVLFESAFRLPSESTKPLRFKAADWRAPDVTNFKGESKPEEKLYEGMARNAFEAFTKKLLATMFRPPPAPPK
jgi:hypothetical protein